RSLTASWRAATRAIAGSSISTPVPTPSSARSFWSGSWSQWPRASLLLDGIPASLRDLRLVAGLGLRPGDRIGLAADGDRVDLLDLDEVAGARDDDLR